MPPGKILRITGSPDYFDDFPISNAFSAGLEAWLYVSQDGRRYD